MPVQRGRPRPLEAAAFPIELSLGWSAANVAHGLHLAGNDVAVFTGQGRNLDGLLCCISAELRQGMIAIAELEAMAKQQNHAT